MYEKNAFNNLNADLVNMNVYNNLVKFCPFTLKIWNYNEIPTSIKGRNSVSNLQKETINNPNLDSMNVNVYKNFGSFLSFYSQDIGRKQISNIKNEALQPQNRSHPSMIKCVQNLVKFCQSILKILSGNEILTSIMGRNLAANLRKNDVLQSQPRSYQC